MIHWIREDTAHLLLTPTALDKEVARRHGAGQPAQAADRFTNCCTRRSKQSASDRAPLTEGERILREGLLSLGLELPRTQHPLFYDYTNGEEHSPRDRCEPQPRRSSGCGTKVCTLQKRTFVVPA